MLRRFIVLPVIFGAVFLAVWFVVSKVWNWIALSLMMRLSDAELYVRQSEFSWTTPATYLLAGLIYGGLVASVDFLKYRRDDVAGRGAVICLLKNLFRDGLVGFAIHTVWFWTLWFTVFYWPESWRHNSFPLDQVFSILRWSVPICILWLTLLWVSVKILRRRNSPA